MSALATARVTAARCTDGTGRVATASSEVVALAAGRIAASELRRSSDGGTHCLLSGKHGLASKEAFLGSHGAAAIGTTVRGG
jgi:hypothetical protein